MLFSVTPGEAIAPLAPLTGWKLNAQALIVAASNVAAPSVSTVSKISRSRGICR